MMGYAPECVFRDVSDTDSGMIADSFWARPEWVSGRFRNTQRRITLAIRWRKMGTSSPVTRDAACGRAALFTRNMIGNVQNESY